MDGFARFFFFDGLQIACSLQVSIKKKVEIMIQDAHRVFQNVRFGNILLQPVQGEKNFRDSPHTAAINKPAH